MFIFTLSKLKNNTKSLQVKTKLSNDRTVPKLVGYNILHLQHNIKTLWVIYPAYMGVFCSCIILVKKACIMHSSQVQFSDCKPFSANRDNDKKKASNKALQASATDMPKAIKGAH